MLSDQIELDVLDFNDDPEKINSSSESSDDSYNKEESDDSYDKNKSDNSINKDYKLKNKKKELKFHDKKNSAKIKLNVRMDDIELLKDGIIQNKIKPEKEEYEINVDIPFDFIFKILKYIK